MDVYDLQKINNWLYSKKREKIDDFGITEIYYQASLEKLIKETKKNTTMCYFLLTKLGIENARTMMCSGVAQVKFMQKVIVELNTWKVGKWKKAFDRDIAGIERRVQFVRKICMENIRLTEYYPFFITKGVEVLSDFDTAFTEEKSTPLDGLIAQINEWSAEHPEEIRRHMEKVKPEIELLQSRREAEKAAKKAEKNAQKAAKKQAREMEKQLEKERKEEKRRKEKWEKEMLTTMRRVGRPRYGDQF